MKVTVVGAGAVGATCADNIARKNWQMNLSYLTSKKVLLKEKHRT
jgi:ketopantoate reductase